MRLTLIVAAALATASLSAVDVSAARAEPALDHSCIAVGGPYQRVAATVAKPEDCCTGRLQCSQFLSTTRVVRPAHDQRT